MVPHRETRMTKADVGIALGVLILVGCRKDNLPGQYTSEDVGCGVSTLSIGTEKIEDEFGDDDARSFNATVAAESDGSCFSCTMAGTISCFSDVCSFDAITEDCPCYGEPDELFSDCVKSDDRTKLRCRFDLCDTNDDTVYGIEITFAKDA